NRAISKTVIGTRQSVDTKYLTMTTTHLRPQRGVAVELLGTTPAGRPSRPPGGGNGCSGPAEASPSRTRGRYLPRAQGMQAFTAAPPSAPIPHADMCRMTNEMGSRPWSRVFYFRQINSPGAPLILAISCSRPFWPLYAQRFRTPRL